MTPDPTTLSIEPEGERSIVMERRFAATPERVFDAFTREDLVMHWLGTPRWPMRACQIDLTVGGAIRYEWSNADGSEQMGMSGRYLAIERPYRIEHTEVFDDDWTGGEVHVVTEFAAEGRSTRMRMTLTYRTAESRDRVLGSGAVRGMDLNFLELDDWLQGRATLFEIDPERDLVLERVVPAPPSRVWAAWTEPSLLERWFAPAPWTVASARVDPHPGGAFDVVMQSPEGERMDSEPGCVLVAEENRLLVWTDAIGAGFAPNAEGFFTAIVRIRPHHEGTHYQVIVRHGTAEARERHEAMGFATGWNAAADQMVAALIG